MTNDLTSRLESSARGVALTDDVKAAHLAAIEASLERIAVVPIDRGARRRRIIAAVTAAALIGPTGLAAASDDALPGDALYGIKQVSEHVTSLFDDEIVPRHRVEEAETLAALGDANRDGAVDRAVEAVAGLDEDHELRRRIAALTASDVAEESDDSADPGTAVGFDEPEGEPSHTGETETITSEPEDPAAPPGRVEEEPEDDHDSETAEDGHEESDDGHEDDASTGD